MPELSPGDLDALYQRQLAHQATPPVARHVNRGQTLAMLRWMQIAWGIRLGADPARCRVWSDLHVNHAGIIAHGGRPFPTLGRMQEHLITAWRECVGANDWIICVGDLAIGPPSDAVDRMVRSLPGRKLVVAGNHEFWAAREPPKNYGVAQVVPTLLVEGPHPAVLTHEPLGSVPRGYVNLNGHLHGGAWPVSRRHVNVNVEQIGYRPARLEEVVATGHAVAAGRIEQGTWTGEAIARYRREAKP